ncbi:GNAT family N-acetyltransferase [Kitasatospora sp. LaBMicrA B282]|uniref:GNAT family N-acetyltransferase n=1 Tax=Kitasatospora sp. LaBMicrA B282 TaxID=3420949 RepID=UPI003D147469
MTVVQPFQPLHAEPIRTARLTLVPLRVAHAEEMAEVLADPGLHAFIGGEPADLAGLQDRYRRWVAGSPDPAQSWCNWVIRLDDAGCLTGTVQATVDAAGVAGLPGPTAEVSWIVGTPWQRRGIAAEAAAGLVDWLAAHAVRTVIAHIHPDHRASAAVAGAVGLRRTEQWQDGELRWQLQLG